MVRESTAKRIGMKIGGILLAAFLLAAPQTKAATTGTISITGTIPLNCNISVAAQANAATLDLTVSQTSLTVATVTESCNNKTGYKVTVATTNGTTGGVMKGGSGNTDTVSYGVVYNGVTQTFSSGTATATNTSVKSAAGGISKSLGITYTGAPAINADTYTDVLTLTMTIN